jgi:hypothetical protein
MDAWRRKTKKLLVFDLTHRKENIAPSNKQS